MPQDWRTLEITRGITFATQRARLKSLFERFGNVVSCWLPVPEVRHQFCDELGFIRFETSEEAQEALWACQSGRVSLDGEYLAARWKQGGNRQAQAKSSGMSADDLLKRLETNYGKKDKKKKKKKKEKKDQSTSGSEEKRKRKKKTEKDDNEQSEEKTMAAPSAPEMAQGDAPASDAKVPGSASGHAGDQEKVESRNQDGSQEADRNGEGASKDGTADVQEDRALAAGSQDKASQGSALESGRSDAAASNSKESRPQACQREQQSPWFLSALEGSMRSFTRLLASGVDVNLTTSRGTSALHLSAKRGSAAFCEALITARADVNKPANNGFTPLHYAVDSSSPLSVCNALLNARAAVDAQNTSGATALHMATASDNDAICKLLRAANASDTIPDNVGNTSAAAQKGKDAAAEQRRAQRKRQRVEHQAKAQELVAVDSDEDVQVVL